MLYRLALFALGIICFACWGVFDVFAQSPKALSTQRVQQALLETQSKIKSFCIDYRGDDMYAVKEGFPPELYLRRIVAAKAPNLWSHETAKGQDLLPWEKDIRRRHCIVENDRVSDNWVTNRAYNMEEWKPEAPLPGSMPGEAIIRYTGIWPLTGRPAPRRDGDHPIMLRDVAKSDKYKVRPELEEIEGRLCHALENPGIDTLWLDVERGCALMARNFYNVKTGVLQTRLEHTKHEEIKPGIWIPRWIRNIEYDYLAENPEQRNRVIIDINIHLTSVQINDVADSMFVFEPKPGALWLNPPKDKSLIPIQTEPGGLDHLDSLVAWGKPLLPTPDPAPVALSAWAIPFLLGLGIVLFYESFLTKPTANIQ